ncbi:MAG: hypothetical protein K6U08_03695 [Firmicutes bacterium]|nr:hypothetical protein [Bacillota bacterium]
MAKRQATDASAEAEGTKETKFSAPEVLARLILGDMPVARLRELAGDLGLTIQGWRREKAPRDLLVRTIEREVRQSPVCLEFILGAFADQARDLLRTVREATVAELRAGFDDLKARYPAGWLTACLLLDGRKSVRRMADTVGLLDTTGGTREEAAVCPASAPGGPAGSATRPDPEALAPHEPETAKTLRRQLARARGELARTQRDLAREREKLERACEERDRLRQQAGTAGQEIGELRKRVASLEEQNVRLRAALETGGPRILGTDVVREREDRLEAAYRSLQRLETENEGLRRQNDYLAHRIGEEQQKNARLRAALERMSARLAAGPQTHRASSPATGTTAPPGAAETEGAGPEDEGRLPGIYQGVLRFAYDGPDGHLGLSRGFRLLVPAAVVRRLDLVDGDLVEVTLGPGRSVNLDLVGPVDREEGLGVVRRVSLSENAAQDPDGPDAGRATAAAPPVAWQLLNLMRRPVAWLSEAEATRVGLADGDVVGYIRPVPGGGGATPEGYGVTLGGYRAGAEGRGAAGLHSPAPGLPALPLARVVRRHPDGLVLAPAEENTGTPGRAVGEAGAAGATKPRRPRLRRREERVAGRQLRRPDTLPLAGRTILVVGGDSFHVSYRELIERLGGRFIGQGAEADIHLAAGRAKSADGVVVVAPYASHKMEGVVEAALVAVGRADCLVRSATKGRRGLLEALKKLPFWPREPREEVRVPSA